MFDIGEREALRQKMIERGREDARITACALVGSAARGEEDAWSDIDIALQLSEHAGLDEVSSDWTAWLRSSVEVADTLDVHGSGALYRVFLLSNSLQIDLSFWPHAPFRSTGEPMHLVFGEAWPSDAQSAQDPLEFIRMGWLYALHARSAVARGRTWQAEMMLAYLRDQVIALACLRLSLNPSHGRGAHLLPAGLSAQLAASRASTLTLGEQVRSLRDTLAVYRTEVAQHDQEVATALAKALDALLLD